MNISQSLLLALKANQLDARIISQKGTACTLDVKHKTDTDRDSLRWLFDDAGFMVLGSVSTLEGERLVIMPKSEYNY